MSDYSVVRFRVDSHVPCLHRLVALIWAGEIPRDDLPNVASRCLVEGGLVMRSEFARSFADGVVKCWTKMPDHEAIPVEVIIEEHSGIVPVAVMGRKGAAKLLDRLDSFTAVEEDGPNVFAIKAKMSDLPPGLKALLRALFEKEDNDKSDDKPVH